MQTPEDVIAANYAEYLGYRGLALSAHARGDARTACYYAEIAARVAAHRHCGFFSSPVLERLLVNIGRQIGGAEAPCPRPARASDIRHVLHVVTELVEVGGHARMLGRWMDADPGRKHSLATTQHEGEIPAFMLEAVARAGGQVHRLDLAHARKGARALALRRLARGHDAVVLHVYSEDVVPMLAFAGPQAGPPVLFLNHADHMFWLGTAISDVVINLRDAASRLSATRRGVAEARNFMVPTLVAETKRKLSRAEAKAQLDLAPDTVMLFSAARAPKYRTMGAETFADTHVGLLQKHPNAVLVVLGVGAPEDWSPAIAATGGRIRPLAPIGDPKPYYEAADIYVDSFPFVSSTSLMEAAGYETPIVTRFYAPEAAEIVGINHPGLIAGALRASDDEAYLDILDRLIGESVYRDQCGRMAHEAVAQRHLPGPWLKLTNDAFDLACALAPIDAGAAFTADAEERAESGEPDRRMNEMFGATYPMKWVIKGSLRELALWPRLQAMRRIAAQGAFGQRREMLAPFVSKELAAALGLDR